MCIYVWLIVLLLDICLEIYKIIFQMDSFKYLYVINAQKKNK